MSFWHKLPKPFFSLAPMADVTDAAFREIIAARGRPHVFYTEFVSADGLVHPVAQERLKLDLRFSPGEHPIVAQLFSSKPGKMRDAAALCRELGFDGVDINMGCPDNSIEKQGAGAAMIKNPSLAQEVIAAAKEGAGELPVSVKTRIGYNQVELETWLPALLAARPEQITLHLRTRKEMSKVSAHWELVPRAVEIARGTGVLIAGNGDVLSLEDAKEKAKQSGMDGVMLGRAIYGNPWLFSGKMREEIPWLERFDTLVEHTELFEKYYGGVKSFAVMKKFFKSYVAGHPQAKEIQEALMGAEDSGGVRTILARY